MPSPRSVLHDIVEQGLNPHHAHSRISGGGNLKAPSVAAEEEPAPVVVVEEQPEAPEAPVKKRAKNKPEPKPGLVKVHCDDCNQDTDCGCECDVCKKPVAS